MVASSQLPLPTGHGALRHHDVGFGQCCPDRAGGCRDRAHVGMAVDARGCIDAQEHDLGSRHGVVVVVGEEQTPGVDPGRETFLEALLEEGCRTGVEDGELVTIDLDTDDVVPEIGEAGRHDRAHVSASDNGDAAFASHHSPKIGSAVVPCGPRHPYPRTSYQINYSAQPCEYARWLPFP